MQAGRLGRSHDPYASLLTGLEATARVDVISGTSAGGLNGGFLALGVVHGCDLHGMRDLWADKGDLAGLLRDPMAKHPPSLLSGDASTFTDDQGTVLTERDYAATFRFVTEAGGTAGDLSDVKAIGEQLAVTSRATSCFPGAFEPHWVDVRDRADSRWPRHRWCSAPGRSGRPVLGIRPPGQHGEHRCDECDHR